MKVLVFSDTHGRIGSAIDIIKSQSSVDLIIHLGDLVKDAKDIQSVFTSIKVVYVPGNNDLFIAQESEKVIDVKGKKLLLTHGHKYRVKQGLAEIIKKGKELKVDGVLFGHTHKAYEEIIDNILYFNPGSLTFPYDIPSYGLIEVKEDKLYSMICSF